MRKVIRSSLIFVAASSFATSSVVASQHGQLDVRIPRDHYLRQLIPASTANSPATTTAAQTSTQSSHTSTTAATSTTTQQPSTTQAASTTQASSTSASITTQGPSADPATSQKSTVVGTVATDSAGDLVTSVITVAASSVPSPTTSSPSDDSSDSGIGTGTIIGLSVAGGVAVIAIICFFIWKLTRKRFSDFDDNEAIKWPELNSHSGGGGGGDVHALPTNSTGRAGFGAENDSDLNLARPPSPGGAYAQSITASSVSGAQDPYAVPPLPHLNPNQPYRDDPGTYGQPGFYDPYRGPIPNTFGEGLVDPGVEAIPMTQMARTRSPGPQIAYDMHGRASPSPQAGYGYGGIGERSASPALSGTRSPAPHVAPYGYGQ